MLFYLHPSSIFGTFWDHDPQRTTGMASHQSADVEAVNWAVRNWLVQSNLSFRNSCFFFNHVIMIFVHPSKMPQVPLWSLMFVFFWVETWWSPSTSNPKNHRPAKTVGDSTLRRAFAARWSVWGSMAVPGPCHGYEKRLGVGSVWKWSWNLSWKPINPATPSNFG